MIRSHSRLIGVKFPILIHSSLSDKTSTEEAITSQSRQMFQFFVNPIVDKSTPNYAHFITMHDNITKNIEFFNVYDILHDAVKFARSTSHGPGIKLSCGRISEI